MSVRLELAVEHDRVARGDTVRGSVHVVEGGRSRSLSVALLYREYQGKAKRATGSGHETREKLIEGDLIAGSEYSFTLRLPDDAWPAYVCEPTGTRLRWEVEATSDQPGVDTRASVPIHIDS